MKEKQESLAKRVGARLERARHMRGYSLRALAEKLDGQYSHTTLQKFEKGLLTPDLKAIGLLARSLDLRADYFLKQSSFTLEQVEYRKLSKLGKKEQQKITEEAFEFFERYLEIEHILSLEEEKLPSFDLSGCPASRLPEELEKAAVNLRKEWNLGLNPIPNVHTMLEEHGIKVKILQNRDGFDGFSSLARTGEKTIGTIALSRNKEQDITRLRFTAIHELGHLVLKLPESLTPADKERACHRFAGAFLVPKPCFEETFGPRRIQISIGELIAIKEEWGISCLAIMARARDLGLITPGRYKAFCIFAAKYDWRTKESQGKLGIWFGKEESKRFQHLVFRALASDVITGSKACGLLDWKPEQLAREFQPIEG